MSDDPAGRVGGPEHAQPAAPPAALADPRVDHALEGLAELDDIDVSHHAVRYDDIHRSLTSALEDADVDETEQ